MAYNTQNAEYGFNFTETDFLGGPYCGALSPVSISGGGKKRKQMRTKKKRGSSKRKNRRVSTLRKKRGSSKRINRGSFKRRKHSKRKVVQSIMKGLGEKRKSRKKSIKGSGWGWRTSSDVEEKYGEALDLYVPQYKIDNCVSKGQKSLQKARATYNCIDKLVESYSNVQPHGTQHQQKMTKKEKKEQKKQEKEEKRRLKETQARFSQYETRRDGRIHNEKQKSSFSLRRNNDKRKIQDMEEPPFNPEFGQL